MCVRTFLRDAMALPHGRPRADKVPRRGHIVDLSWQRAGTRRTKNGHMADTWWTHARQTQEADKFCKRGQSGHKADMWRKIWRQTQGGHMADTRRAHGGQMAGQVWKADTWLTQGGHMADKVWRHAQSRLKAGTRRADTRRTRRGQAHSRRTKSGHIAEHAAKADLHAETQGGHKTNTWRTSSGDAARAYCGQPFFPKRTPE